MTGRRRAVWILLAAAVAIAGCAGQAGEAQPSAITCHTQYRPDDATLTGATEPSLTVARSDEVGARPQRLDFDTLRLEVAFHGDVPEGDNVTVVVLTPEGEPLVRDLYQLGDGTELEREFAGGHGFTGLQYVFHEGASLQVWCVPGEA